GIAACFKEYDMTIPESLIQGFDEKEFGIQFLNNIDLQLFKMAA
ncbi:MAG: ADP-ribosylglycohydrolase family protein, partial [Gammaproteobacteria bacterium]